jgi:hypothetical protein
MYRELDQLPFLPYPNDWPTRIGLIIGDIIAFVIIFGMIIIPLKTVLNY